MITEAQIARINELARKSKTEGLSPEEKEEQAGLRRLYLDAIRANMRSQLDNTVVVTPDGKRHPLRKDRTH